MQSHVLQIAAESAKFPIGPVGNFQVLGISLGKPLVQELPPLFDGPQRAMS